MPEDEPPQSKSYRGVFIVVVAVAFAGLFAWAYFMPSSNAKSSRVTSESGLYEQYAYVITTTAGQSQKAASFNPAIHADDATVVGALREVMQTAYDQKVADSIEPAVENANEKNYVTFSYDGTKTYFELFKSGSGDVGSVRFWRDSTDKY